jgi:hypothetical protein
MGAQYSGIFPRFGKKKEESSWGWKSEPIKNAGRHAMALRRMAVTGTKAPQYRMNYECAAESRRIFEEGETGQPDSGLEGNSG